MGYSEELWLACGKYSKSLATVIICTIAVIIRKSHKGFYWADSIKTGCSERDGKRIRLTIYKGQGALQAEVRTWAKRQVGEEHAVKFWGRTNNPSKWNMGAWVWVIRNGARPWRTLDSKPSAELHPGDSTQPLNIFK